MLRVEPGELDVDRFRGLLERGREQLAAGDPREAASTLRSALAICRGPPLADLSYEPFAQPAIAEFDELRLAALEERVEADLALGAHRELIGELTAAVGRDPLRERLRAQLMLALYRCGRQAEALDAYQEFRRALSEELGLDPGPRLQQLELAILSRDSSLDLPTSSTTRGGSSAPPPSRAPPDRRHLRLALGGSALLVLALAVVMIAASVGGRAPPSVVTANSVGAIGPADGAIRAVVPLRFSPAALAAGDGARVGDGLRGRDCLPDRPGHPRSCRHDPGWLVANRDRRRRRSGVARKRRRADRVPDRSGREPGRADDSRR